MLLLYHSLCDSCLYLDILVFFGFETSHFGIFGLTPSSMQIRTTSTVLGPALLRSKQHLGSQKLTQQICLSENNQAMLDKLDRTILSLGGCQLKALPSTGSN